MATFTNLGDNTAETITLTFSSGNLAPATSSTSIVVSPAAGGQAASSASSRRRPRRPARCSRTQPVVEEVDQYGNVVTGDSTDTVTAARGDIGTSTLLGNKLTVTLVNGVATFSGLSYNTAEAMDITFTSGASGISPVTSNPVLVAPTTPSQLVIQQQPSSTATAGQPFATQPVVYEEDQFGNLETGDNTTPVTAILASGSGPLQGTTTVTLSGGVATFSDLADNTAETIALAFTRRRPDLPGVESDRRRRRRRPASWSSRPSPRRPRRPASRSPSSRSSIWRTPTATSRRATTPRR